MQQDPRINQELPEHVEYGKFNVQYDGVVLEREVSFNKAQVALSTIAEIKVPYHLIGWCWEHQKECFVEYDEEPEYCGAISFMHPVFWDGERGERFIHDELDLYAVLV